MANDPRRRWGLLIHSLPARPLYLRARIRRELARAGAAPLKKAVYALPFSAAGLERLRAIAAGIEAAGASAFVCQASFDERADAAVLRAYNDERHAQYRAWIREARAARAARSGAARLARLRQRLEGLRAHDRFAAPGAAEAAAALADLERRHGAPTRARAGRSRLVGLRWVTRKGLHVDRLACAWVVRRFVDPAAEFRFVSAPDAPLEPDEIGFDMTGAAITHEAGRCSVETLVGRVGLREAAVARIAEIVHDIDLKDARHGHPETPGFERLLTGTIASLASDEQRLERGLALFDALYTALSRGAALPVASPPERRPLLPPSLAKRPRP